MSARDLPLPPFELANRVGSLESADDPWDLYDVLGRATLRDLLDALPEGFEFEGRRVLDFGCGAGRTLRHLVAAQLGCELTGCDIDPESVAWLERNLSPPVEPFANGEMPPLNQPDASFDLIYCVSVFTHLTRSWSAWMVDLHRVLKPDGLLLATFMGEGQASVFLAEDWNEDEVGMRILHPGQSWDLGGPMVLHSPWWIREHWGRLFDVVALSPDGFAVEEPGTGQGLAVLRRKEVRLTPDELETPSGDHREARALARNVASLVDEMEAAVPALAHQRQRADDLEHQLHDLHDRLASSRSWRMTRPLRHLAAGVRAVRRAP